MLVLSRKENESIYIDTGVGVIKISINLIKDYNVRVGIDAPRDMSIYRDDAKERKKSNKTKEKARH